MRHFPKSGQHKFVQRKIKETGLLCRPKEYLACCRLLLWRNTQRHYFRLKSVCGRKRYCLELLIQSFIKLDIEKSLNSSCFRLLWITDSTSQFLERDFPSLRLDQAKRLGSKNSQSECAACRRLFQFCRQLLDFTGRTPDRPHSFCDFFHLIQISVG